jgi:hypothetical protein
VGLEGLSLDGDSGGGSVGDTTHRGGSMGRPMPSSRGGGGGGGGGGTPGSVAVAGRQAPASGGGSTTRDASPHGRRGSGGSGGGGDGGGSGGGGSGTPGSAASPARAAPTLGSSGGSGGVSSGRLRSSATAVLDQLQGVALHATGPCLGAVQILESGSWYLARMTIPDCDADRWDLPDVACHLTGSPES